MILAAATNPQKEFSMKFVFTATCLFVLSTSALASQSNDLATLEKNADGSSSITIDGPAAMELSRLVESSGNVVVKRATIVCAPPEPPSGTECEIRIAK